jgi:hypothetical protein
MTPHQIPNARKLPSHMESLTPLMKFTTKRSQNLTKLHKYNLKLKFISLATKERLQPKPEKINKFYEDIDLYVRCR